MDTMSQVIHYNVDTDGTVVIRIRSYSIGLNEPVVNPIERRSIKLNIICRQIGLASNSFNSLIKSLPSICFFLGCHSQAHFSRFRSSDIAEMCAAVAKFVFFFGHL